MSLLSVQSLKVALPGGAAIVDGVSFNIAAGETFALLGESGCGKSLTALALLRLLPDGLSGSGAALRLGDTALDSLSEREMRQVRGGRMAMIFQEPGLSLNPVMTVGAQVAEVLALHSGLRGESARQRVAALFTQVGIPDPARRVDEYPFQLSGGMKQRVMIAMALAGEPELLIADEPTTALDVTIQAQVLALLRQIQQQRRMAMLLITHDLGVVAENAHRVGVMYAGQIVEQATREALFVQPLHPYTRKLFAAMPDMQRRGQSLSAIPGSVPVPGSMPPGCRFAPRCDRAWALCHEQAPMWNVLEDGRGVRCHLYGEDGGKKEEGDKTVGGKAEGASGAGASPIFQPAAPLLQVDNLQVHFPIRHGILQRTSGYVKAVDGVSLSIEKGKTLALVGESGCGKTTLGKALLQLVPGATGRIRFAGQDLAGDAGRVRRAAMQMVFQDPYASLNPKMRIAEILEEGMAALNVGGDRASRQTRIDELLPQVGLPQSAKWRYPHEFSGGQRQRIAIARALAVAPGLLICDEPTSALDVSVQAQILNLLKSLQDELGLSYLFITHNLAVVEFLAHEVCVMYLGRIVERGTAEEVMRTPKHPYTQALLAAVPRVDAANATEIRLAGDMPSSANPPPGCHFAPRCPQAKARCRAAYPEAVACSPTHVVHCVLYAPSQVDGGGV
jgi:peptide/nickel transport system ATP-binding protein